MNCSDVYLRNIVTLIGTGLAFTTVRSGYATSDHIVNQHFYFFLCEFFKLHPRYLLSISKSNADGSRQRTRPLFLTGESHAGHYIPSMATYISERNAQSDIDLHIDVRGLLIGNGWIDPVYDMRYGVCNRF